MKLFSYFLLLLVVLLNLVFAQPSWADAPKITKSPEYKELTKSLDVLTSKLEAAKSGEPLPSDLTIKDLQKKVDELSFEKYALERGLSWGQCTNETGKTIAVYGPKSKKDKSESSYDNALYFLGNGQTTPTEWDCQGIYLPSDTKIANLNTDPNQNLDGAIAIKILKGTQLVAKSNPDTGVLELNTNPSKIFQAGDVKWYIPNVPAASIASRVPNVPQGEESD
ncbi:MAG: hypothetical protein KME64_14725 [Scytonematopsis contorta HA4267-MV1]|jgi:hypothetical protein|nr:hypothetical protein [Scytonematopsis contorta HA4267-MV1]